VVAAQKLSAGEVLEPAYNLGSGVGSTVAEVMEQVAHVTKLDVVPQRVARRPGDPSTVVASGDLAARDVGWSMGVPLEDMVSSAWREYTRAHGAL
jgi:UDP-glucose 4-epimerase